jgi:hypothetical protein
MEETEAEANDNVAMAGTHPLDKMLRHSRVNDSGKLASIISETGCQIQRCLPGSKAEGGGGKWKQPPAGCRES